LCWRIGHERKMIVAPCGLANDPYTSAITCVPSRDQVVWRKGLFEDAFDKEIAPAQPEDGQAGRQKCQTRRFGIRDDASCESSLPVVPVWPPLVWPDFFPALFDALRATFRIGRRESFCPETRRIHTVWRKRIVKGGFAVSLFLDTGCVERGVP
jgi:hypothetical protein